MLTPLTDEQEYCIVNAVLSSDDLCEELGLLTDAVDRIARIFKVTPQVETRFPSIYLHEGLILPDHLITVGQAYRFRFTDKGDQCVGETKWTHLPSGYEIVTSSVPSIESFANHILERVFSVEAVAFPEDQSLTEAHIGVLRKVLTENGLMEDSGRNDETATVGGTESQTPYGPSIDYDTAHEIYKKHQDGAPEGDWIDDLVAGLNAIGKEMDSLERGFHIRLYTSRTRTFRLAKEGITRKSLLTLKKKPLCISFYVKDKRVGYVEGVNYLYLSDRPKKAVSDLLVAIRNEVFDVLQRLHD